MGRSSACSNFMHLQKTFLVRNVLIESDHPAALPGAHVLPLGPGDEASFEVKQRYVCVEAE
jgi:hypothetical protein